MWLKRLRQLKSSLINSSLSHKSLILRDLLTHMPLSLPKSVTSISDLAKKLSMTNNLNKFASNTTTSCSWLSQFSKAMSKNLLIISKTPLMEKIEILQSQSGPKSSTLRTTINSRSSRSKLRKIFTHRSTFYYCALFAIQTVISQK